MRIPKNPNKKAVLLIITAIGISLNSSESIAQDNILLKPSESEPKIVAISNLKNKDGWETLRFACVSKFKGKENLGAVTEKCSQFLNVVRANNLEIVPFSASDFDKYPKLRRSMSKKELFEKFGRPESVSDDGAAIYFNNKQFCKVINSFSPHCTVYFFQKGQGVSKWDNFKYEFTDNLKDE